MYKAKKPKKTYPAGFIQLILTAEYDLQFKNSNNDIEWQHK
jgi:hypothetical protein